MAITAATIVHYVSKSKDGISPSEFRNKYRLNKGYGMATRFSDAFKAGLLKKGKKTANSQAYTATAKGIAMAAKETIQTPEEMIAESNNPRSKGSRAPVIPMNAKANTAIDSISKLLDDYNRANQMLKIIHSQIGDYLNDNQKGVGSNEQQGHDTETDQSSGTWEHAPGVKRSSKRPAKRAGKKRNKKY